MPEPATAPVIRFVPPGAPPRFRVEVRPGEMALLAGPPGAGAASILRRLAGLAAPAPGEAQVGGSDLACLPHRQRRARIRDLRLAYVPGSPALVSNIPVMDNLLLPVRYFAEMEEGPAWRHARALLDAAGLGWAAGLLPAALSTEDRRTVALLRALVRRPRVALLEEPLDGLDAAGLAAVRPLLRRILDRGECALLVATGDAGAYRGLPFREIAIPEEREGET